jgi:hypothetical protein
MRYEGTPFYRGAMLDDGIQESLEKSGRAAPAATAANWLWDVYCGIVTCVQVLGPKAKVCELYINQDLELTAKHIVELLPGGLHSIVDSRTALDIARLQEAEPSNPGQGRNTPTWLSSTLESVLLGFNNMCSSIAVAQQADIDLISIMRQGHQQQSAENTKAVAEAKVKLQHEQVRCQQQMLLIVSQLKGILEYYKKGYVEMSVASTANSGGSLASK